MHASTPSSQDRSDNISWKFLATAHGANLGSWMTSGSCGSVFLEGVGDHLCLGVGRSAEGKETIGFVALLPTSDPMTSTPGVAPMNAMRTYRACTKTTC